MLYAGGCIDALYQPEKYEFLIALVSPDGMWRLPQSLKPSDIKAVKPVAVHIALQQLALSRIDVALPQMFCLAGMTSYRALLETLGLAYLGNRPFQMALTADKAKAKAVVQAAGVRVPAGELLFKGQQPTMLTPAVVKPNHSDNSDGVNLVMQASDYAAALEVAFAYGDTVLVEQYVPLGREVRCGIVVQNGVLRPLPLEEYFVDPMSRPIRTGADKLRRDNDNQLVLAAKQASEAWMVDVADPVVPAVWHAAKACHVALGCEQYSLFDFRIDPEGVPWFLEAGLYCSYSPKSVIPTMMEAAGTPLKEFFDQSISQLVGTPLPLGSVRSPTPSLAFF